MDIFGLDNNINQITCKRNTNKQVLQIDTENYAGYDFITLHNYYRVFIIIGLLIVIVLVPLSKFIGNISNSVVRVGVMFIMTVCTALGLTGFIGMMIACSKYYNITERIYIYKNPKLGDKTCNISYGFENGSDIYMTTISKSNVGLIQLTTFFLIIAMIIFYGIFLINGLKASSDD